MQSNKALVAQAIELLKRVRDNLETGSSIRRSVIRQLEDLEYLYSRSGLNNAK